MDYFETDQYSFSNIENNGVHGLTLVFLALLCVCYFLIADTVYQSTFLLVKYMHTS